MENVVAYTVEYSKEDKYAKLFTLYKSFKNITDWHDNQMVFTIFQCNSYIGYIEKKYFIASIKGNNSTDKVIFNCLSDNLANKLDCIYKDNGDSIDIYVKGHYEAVGVKMKIDYTKNRGFYTYYLFQKFDTEKTDDFVSATIKNYTITPTWNGGWTINDNYYNVFKLEGNKVIIKAIMKSSILNTYYSITKLPEGLRPKKNYYNTVRYLSTDENWYDGEITINTYGDILVNCTHQTEKFPIYIEYYI